MIVDWKCHTMKMPIFPQIATRFKSISIKISARIFVDVKDITLKCIRKVKIKRLKQF